LGVLVWRGRWPSKWIPVALYVSVFPFSSSSSYCWVSSSSFRPSPSPFPIPWLASSQSAGAPLRTES
jgi:hypothetical protein